MCGIQWGGVHGRGGVIRVGVSSLYFSEYSGGVIVLGMWWSEETLLTEDPS